MSLFLALHSTYTAVDLGLFDDTRTLGTASLDKTNASKLLVLTLSALLDRHTLTISDLDFIAAGQGPAPFTTLRSVITTVNGIAFATGIPLIGIDSLQALVDEYIQKHNVPTIALLNAFGNDIYYLCALGDGKADEGCANIEYFLNYCANLLPDIPVHFIGNGAELFSDLIKQKLGERAIIAALPAPYVSLPYSAQYALHKWHMQQDIADQLLPLYLKTQHYQKSTAP